jgi:hypothetical protein
MPAFPVFMVPCWLLAATQGVGLPPAIALLSARLDPLAPPPAEKARVFSVHPGGVVPAVAPGQGRFDLADGEVVQFLDWEQGQDMNDAVATVNARGREVKVPNDQVATADRTFRSPDGQWAVVVAIQTCDGGCRGVGWVLGSSLRARFSTYMAADPQVAWRSDSGEVAIDSGGLYVISLPDGQLTTSGDRGKPSYATDGRLFIRPGDDRQDAYQWRRDDHPQIALSGDGEDSYVPGGAGAPDPTPVPLRARRPAMAYRPPTRARGNSASPRPADLDQTLMVILDEGTPVPQAARLVRRQRLGNPAAAHEVGRAANTRGFRLLKAGDQRKALAMFEAAASADPRYGMPRYSAARIYAMRGDSRGAARWLKSLKSLPRSERRRLAMARSDQAFARVAAAPEIRVLLHGLPRGNVRPRMAESSGPIGVYRRARRGR